MASAGTRQANWNMIMKPLPIALAVAVISGAIMIWWQSPSAHADEPAAFATAKQSPVQPMEKVTKSDEEWKKLLSPEQFQVARKAGTEIDVQFA